MIAQAHHAAAGHRGLAVPAAPVAPAAARFAFVAERLGPARRRAGRRRVGRRVVGLGRLRRLDGRHRLDGRLADLINNLAFILGALLLMAPFGFIPFSNTLPGLALLCLAVGLLQRDGVAILLGHLANVATMIYFGILLGGGGLVIKELIERYWPAG